MAAATTLYAGIQAFVFLSPWPAGTENDPSHARIALFLLSNLTYLAVLLVCVVSLIAGWGEKRSSGRPPRRPAPGAGGQASRCPSSPARAESFRRPVAVTSTPPKLSGAVLPGRQGGLTATAAIAPSRAACRDGWKSPCDEPQITCPEDAGQLIVLPLMTATIGWAAAAATARIRPRLTASMVPVPFTAAGPVGEGTCNPVATPQEAGRAVRVRSWHRTAILLLLCAVVAATVFLAAASWLRG